MNFRTYGEFWPFYLSQAQQTVDARLAFRRHGLRASLSGVGGRLDERLVSLLAAPVLGYGLAWFSHFFIEGNKPATFGHPLWSLRADFHMFWLMLTGKLEKELRRLREREAK